MSQLSHVFLPNMALSAERQCLFRCSYLSWDDYFIALAFLSAQRSKDPNKQVCRVGSS